ncbi:hypothetical protein HDU84_000822 [Entophlyctis sp. JEL0112]|nr:hypothetical protein HDU84_000822 [Entophlyctis sp. JEL0112]
MPELQLPSHRRDTLLSRRIRFRETATVGRSEPRPQTPTSLASVENDRAVKSQERQPSSRRRFDVFEKVPLLLSWPKPYPAGPGLVNLGNTCFLNSTLQCLTYTPALAMFLLSRSHSQKCRQTSFCTFCELEKHVIRSLSGARSKSAITPKSIVGRLKSIAKHFRIGRQEDSHEFLRYFIDSLQNSCLFGFERLDHSQKETTVIHQIFGGYLQSRIVCSVCKEASCTVEPCLDISLEVKNCNSIEKALARFTKLEILDDENKYRCSKCKTLVQASKRMTILEAPATLVLQLKRFEFGHYGLGGKITKMITFQEKLDLQPFMYKADSRVVYDLYGVLVHSGHSCNSGHYYSFVKAPNGIWFLKNDSEVSISKVLEQHAYILFYTSRNSVSPLYSYEANYFVKTPSPETFTSFLSEKKTLPFNPSIIRDHHLTHSTSNWKVSIADATAGPTKPTKSVTEGRNVTAESSLGHEKGKLENIPAKKTKSEFSVGEATSTVVPWEVEETEALLQKRDILMMREGGKKMKRPSDHDLEYDQGKTKKRKKKRNPTPDLNRAFFKKVGEGGDNRVGAGADGRIRWAKPNGFAGRDKASRHNGGFSRKDEFEVFDDQDQVIVSVGLVKPLPGVFLDEINHLLVVATPIEIILVAVAHKEEKGVSNLNLYRTAITIASDNISMTSIVGSANGRIFMCGSNGRLYELQYQADEGWFTRKCRIIDLTVTTYSMFIPTFLNLSEEDPIQKIVVDVSRNILYALTERSNISLYYLGDDGKGFKFKERQTDIFSQAQKWLEGYNMYPHPYLDPRNFHIVGIHVIPVSESSIVHLMAVSSSGEKQKEYASSNVISWAQRLYFEIGGKPSLRQENSQQRVLDNGPLGRPLTSNEYDLSGRHEGLALYLARLLAPLWKETLVKKVPGLSKGVGKGLGWKTSQNVLGSIADSLAILNKLLDDTPSLTAPPSPNEIDYSSIGTSQSVGEKEAWQEEKASMRNLHALIKRVIEGINFIMLLMDFKFLSLADTFVPCFQKVFDTEVHGSLEDKLVKYLLEESFESLVTLNIGIDLGRQIFTKIIQVKIKQDSGVSEICDLAQNRCPSFCCAEDVLLYKGMECLSKAKSENGQLGRRLLSESLNLFLNILPTLSFDKIVELVYSYTSGFAHQDAVTLVLSFAQSEDPSCAGFAYLEAGRPANDHRESQFSIRQKCYQLVKSVILSVELPAAEESVADAREVDKFRESLINYGLGFDDKLFHYFIFDWFMEERLYDRLLKLNSRYLEDFLAFEPIAFERINLLWKFYVHQEAFMKAAQVLNAMASSKIYGIPFIQRLELLQLAVANARSATVTVADHDFFRELEDKRDVALVQMEIVAAVSKMNGVLPADDVLFDSLLTISDLFLHYAKPLNLHEICLLIFHTADNKDRHLISQTWLKIIKEGTSSSDKLLLLEETIKNLGMKYAADANVFPLGIGFNMFQNPFLRTAAGGDFSNDGISWVIRIMRFIGVSFTKLFEIYYDMSETRNPPWNTATGEQFITAKLTYLISEWCKSVETSLVERTRFPAKSVDDALCKLLLSSGATSGGSSTGGISQQQAQIKELKELQDKVRKTFL